MGDEGGLVLEQKLKVTLGAADLALGFVYSGSIKLHLGLIKFYLLQFSYL